MSREADFFDLGGDSISVFRVIGQIKEHFGVDLPVREFFAHSVLAELARAIDARRAR
jgi:acyl carrier protein